MEFVLAIIIGAIGLVLFLQRAEPAPPPRSTALGWDLWALDNGWKFFPKSQDAPMTLFGTLKKYPINIYARRNSGLTDDARDETEIRIRLKYNILEGLKIQSWDGVEQTSRMARSKQLSFGREALDQKLYAEAIDALTGDWKVHQQDFRQLCESLIDLHPGSCIDERSLTFRKKGLKASELQDAINEALSLAEDLDQSTFSMWKKLIEEHSLQLRPTDQSGNPSLKGYIDDVEVTISVETHDFFGFRVIYKLPMIVPADIILKGFKPDSDEHVLFRDSVVGTIGQYPTAQDLPQNPAFAQPTILLFREAPSTTLIKRNLEISVESKRPDQFNKFFSLGLDLSQALAAHFGQPETPEI